MVFAPLSYLFTYQFIQRFPIDKLILKLTAGRVGGLYKNEETFLFLFAHIDERFHTVRSQIRIDGSKILIKTCIGLASHLYFSQMSGCIGCGSGTNIATFNITDHYQILGFTIIYSFLICLQSLDTELLIHGNLRFYCRDQVISLVYDLFVELPDCLCSAFQSLAKLVKCFFLNVLRYIRKHRVKSYHDGGFGFLNFVDQLINHGNLLLLSCFFLRSSLA